MNSLGEPEENEKRASAAAVNGRNNDDDEPMTRSKGKAPLACQSAEEKTPFYFRYDEIALLRIIVSRTYQN